MKWVTHPIGTKDNTREKVAPQVRYDRAKTQTCEAADVSKELGYTAEFAEPKREH
jgi:hypothetical protein